MHVRIPSTLLAVAIVASARSLAAQTSGTYQMEGGSYSITVEAGTNELVVIEPNKRSVYTRVGQTNEYRFFNPNTGSTFALTVVDARTLRASRIPQTIAPNTLRLVGAATASAAATDNARFKAMADRYRLLAEGDTDNTQMWTFCAAAAQGWVVKTEAEAALYAWKAAQQLKPIMVDPSRSPCRDAIPQALWESATAPAAGSALARAPQASGTAGAQAVTPAPRGTQGAIRAESPEAAALRERAAVTAAATQASTATVEAMGQQREAELRQEARGRLEGEAASAVTRLAGDRLGDLSRIAPMMPSAQEWLAVFKDFTARRKAIAAQDEYLAQVRKDRLASGAPDVQGFAAPLRPAPDQVVLPATGARVTGMGIWPDYDPNMQKTWFDQLDAMAKAKAAERDFTAYQGLRPRMDPEEWRPGFSASLVPSRARVQLIIESAEGKLQKYAIYQCSVFGPDGKKLSTAQLTANDDTRRHSFEVLMLARGWKPGVYGVECGPYYGAPWANLTFDVTP